jgi:Uma2 family endonuclease
MTITNAKRFTISEYESLAKLGFFREDERVELINGEIISMVSKGTRHSVCETRLERQLYELVGKRATLRGQQPIIISEYNEPEPDRAIVKNREDDYLNGHPLPDDVLLLIEIADSSLKYDQETKLLIYARGGISDYWIFNLMDNCLECYSEPYEDVQGKFGYRKKLIFLPTETVPLSCFPDLLLDLSKVFPETKK